MSYQPENFAVHNHVGLRVRPAVCVCVYMPPFKYSTTGPYCALFVMNFMQLEIRPK